MDGFNHFKFGSDEEQEKIFKNIMANRQWVEEEHCYLMKDVNANSTEIVKQGSREVRVPCIIKVPSAYRKSSSKVASLLTRTLDHFDKKQLLSFDREDQVLLMIRDIVENV